MELKIRAPFLTVYFGANLHGTPFEDAVVAEWLRRLTRNQIPSGSVGSNPTDCEKLALFWFLTCLQETLR